MDRSAAVLNAATRDSVGLSVGAPAAPPSLLSESLVMESTSGAVRSALLDAVRLPRRWGPPAAVEDVIRPQLPTRTAALKLGRRRFGGTPLSMILESGRGCKTARKGPGGEERMAGEGRVGFKPDAGARSFLCRYHGRPIAPSPSPSALAPVSPSPSVPNCMLAIYATTGRGALPPCGASPNPPNGWAHTGFVWHTTGPPPTPRPGRIDKYC